MTSNFLTREQLVDSLRRRADYFESAEGGWRDDTAALLRDAAASFEATASDRELLLGMLASIPDHETSAVAMGNAYWNWREKVKAALPSIRAMARAEKLA